MESTTDSPSTATLIFNATQKTRPKSSDSSSSLSTETLIFNATQGTNRISNSLQTSKSTFHNHLDSSTPSDVSLSDDDEEVRKAALHLQHISRLLSSQEPPSSESDPDEDYQMETADPNPQSQRSLSLPSHGNRLALPIKLGK